MNDEVPGQWQAGDFVVRFSALIHMGRGALSEQDL